MIVDATPEAEYRSRAPWHRVVILGGLALTLLLVGVIIGVMINLPGQRTVPAADSIDVGFSQDMTVHHNQAITMASWERDHTTDTQLRVLATDIEATQSGQVGRLQGWLDMWGAAPLPNGGFMGWMTADAGHAGMTTTTGPVPVMPGMASDADLKAMRTTTGKQLDVLFLQLMLRHHEGGAAMLSYAAERAGSDQVRTLAGQMLRAQTAESDYMRQLLAARGGTPLPL